MGNVHPTDHCTSPASPTSIVYCHPDLQGRLLFDIFLHHAWLLEGICTGFGGRHQLCKILSNFLSQDWRLCNENLTGFWPHVRILLPGALYIQHLEYHCCSLPRATSADHIARGRVFDDFLLLRLFVRNKRKRHVIQPVCVRKVHVGRDTWWHGAGAKLGLAATLY
jgi:hypothetical protein